MSHENFCHALHLFGSISTISRSGEHFLDGQYSLVSLLIVCCSSTHCVLMPSHL